VFPGLAVESVRVAEQAAFYTLRNDPDRLELGALAVPMDARAEMRLHFSPLESWPRRNVPAWAVLTGEGDATARLKDKIVLIGASAGEAGASLPIPGAAFVTRPPATIRWERAAIGALGLAAVALAVWFGPVAVAIAALALAGGWLSAVALGFVRYGLLLDPLGPALAALIGANVTEIAAFIRTRALKTAITSKFERYVPPEVVARLVREPETLKLDGELKEVTALLTDVEGFSGMTERSEPRILVATLDAYFDRVTELIVGHGGMVDKIVGDAVLAYFNIPAPVPDHADAVASGGPAAASNRALRSWGMSAEGGGWTTPPTASW
jgi:adenylate cyclase